jgi:hypothetical protein
VRNKYIFHELQLNSEQEVFSFYMVIIILYTVLPRNKLINTAVRSRFVRFADAVRAVAVRAICGCGSCGLRSRVVQFAVAVRSFFSPTAENHGVVFRRFPTTTVIIHFLNTRFIFQYCDYICRSLLYTM